MCRVRDFETYVFFQAEDGIRDIGVTGVQTCALPIYDGDEEEVDDDDDDDGNDGDEEVDDDDGNDGDKGDDDDE